MIVRSGIRVIRPGFGWFLVAMGVLGAALVAICIRLYGPGLSPDSVGYISIARNLASGGTYRNYGGGVAPEWPPLYPILAAILQKLTGIDALTTTGLINVLSHGLTVYASGLLLSRIARHSPLAKHLGTVAIAISPALLAVSVMAWTEPLFICCLVLFLLVGHQIVAGEQRRLPLLLLTLFAALAALTRYIGVVLIPVGALVILLFYTIEPLKRLAVSGLFSLGALVPVGAWVWRNHRLTGTLMGSRSPSIFTLSDNLGFTLGTIRAWFLPEKAAPARFGLAIAVGLLGFVVWVLLRRRIKSPETRAAFALPAFLLMVAYLVFLIVSSTTTAYDQISNRLVVPIYVPPRRAADDGLGPAVSALGGTCGQHPGNLRADLRVRALVPLYER